MMEKHNDEYTTCPACSGSGASNDGSACNECGGSGKRQNACQVPEGPEHTGVCD
ncbi:chaperone protein [uncultured Desulfovibrio sp.]|uniref:chaperone protein n=1 Tax=uncultured Desulfovibrio sp. TaxID=167968 RepID=UPI00262BD6DC|nr:chaperone protein [uncultured Desulfovibrio sp.]